MTGTRVLRQINRGGFGRVEEVQLGDGTRAAKKVFDPAMFLPKEDLEKFRKRFRHEVKIQSELPEGIAVPILASHLEDDPPSFLMPMAERSYREQMEEDRRASRIDPGPLADVLNALEELHHLGFVHRDLKPENVLRHDGRWKLADFGLVLVTDGSLSRLTSMSSAWGTQGYCAPEQFKGFRHVTPAADIYSFGCMLHDLVDTGGRIPFQRYTGPDPLGPIIEKCTEVDPARRFRSISMLRESLLTALADPVVIPRDAALREWLERLGAVATWTTSEAEEFVRMVLRFDRGSEEADAIFRTLDDSAFATLHAIDPGAWATLAESYCDWAWGSFEFEYCDVVAARLRSIFDLGDLTIKARAALAATELGYSHNRWHVMRVVMRMCDESMDEAAAKRVALEIRVADAAQQFRRCAGGINRSFEEYHPVIAKVLAKASS